MIREFDFTEDLKQSILWQYEDAEKIISLIENKQAFFDENHTQFWNDWYNNVFNIDTCNKFGLFVWSIILGIPFQVGEPFVTGFGFGANRFNFGNGNFAQEASGVSGLTVQQLRIALKMRYAKLTTGCTIPEINKILFNAFGSGVYVRQVANMEIEYVFTGSIESWVDSFFEELDVFPTPACVGASLVQLVIESITQVGNSFSISGIGFPALSRLNGTDVAFIDATLESLRTYRLNGSTWSQVGSGFKINSAGRPALAALNSTDVAFIDATLESLRTYRFNGSTWSQVGSSFSIGGTGAPALAALNGTDVAFIDDSNKSLRLYRWNGSVFAQLGSGLTITGILAPALAALNGTDVAFIDATLEQLRLYRWNGSVFAQLGSGLTITGIGSPALCALNGTDVAFIDDSNKLLSTYRFNGSTWSPIGETETITGAGVPALAALNGTDVAFIDRDLESLRTYRIIY